MLVLILQCTSSYTGSVLWYASFYSLVYYIVVFSLFLWCSVVYYTLYITLVSSLSLLELNLLEDGALCWAVVWKTFPIVEALDPDKQVSTVHSAFTVYILSALTLYWHCNIAIYLVHYTECTFILAMLASYVWILNFLCSLVVVMLLYCCTWIVAS